MLWCALASPHSRLASMCGTGVLAAGWAADRGAEMGYKLSLGAGLTCALTIIGVGFGQIGFAAATTTNTTNSTTINTTGSGLAAGSGAAVTTVQPRTSATAGSVTGLVRGPRGQAVAGYTVEVFTPDGNFVADAVTDIRGRYTVSGLPRGPYRVRVSGPKTGPAPWAMAWVGQQPSLLKAAVVNVAGSPLTADVVLASAAVATGRVEGVAVGSEVKLCGETFLDCRGTVTRPDGSFELRGLAAGTASVVVRPVGGGELAFPAQPPRAGIPLRANQTTQILLDARSQSAPRVAVQGKEVRQSPAGVVTDRRAPRVLSATLSQHRGKRFVTVVASDGQGGSGLAQVQVRTGDRERPPSPFITDPISAPGSGKVAVRVQDKAGQFSAWVVAR